MGGINRITDIKLCNVSALLIWCFRSPGGRPFRSPRLHDEPAKVLADVLKRRFAAIHYKNDSDKDECSDHSFNSTASDYAIAAT